MSALALHHTTLSVSRLTLSGVTSSTRRKAWTTGSIGETLVAASESDSVVVGPVPGLLRRTRVRLVYLRLMSFETTWIPKETYLEGTIVTGVLTGINSVDGSVQHDRSTTSTDVPGSGLSARKRDEADIVSDITVGDSGGATDRGDTEVTVDGLNDLVGGSFGDWRGETRTGQER